LNGVSLNGSTLYVFGLPVCNECAKAIVQVGIKRVVFRAPPKDNGYINLKWEKAWSITKSIFREAGVDFKQYD